MMYKNYNPNLKPYAPVGNNRYHQQLNRSKFRYIPDEDTPKNEPNNASPTSSSPPNPNNIVTGCAYQDSKYNSANYQQSPTPVQPVFYPYYNYYMNSINYNYFPYYQQVPFQPQIADANNLYKNQINSFNPNNLNYVYYDYPPQQAERKIPKLCNGNDFYNYTNPVQGNPNYEDDDSFGSIFYPFSLIHPTQYIKNHYIQNSSVEKPNSQQINEVESGQNEKGNNLEATNIITPISSSDINENSNTSNIQPNQERPLEKVDNQKGFRPKTFKEIEEEEKKSQIHIHKQIPNTDETGIYKSFKRGTKSW